MMYATLCKPPLRICHYSYYSFNYLVRSFCTLSETELLKLHDTEPSRAIQIYNERINTINQHDNNTEALFTTYMHLRDVYWKIDDNANVLNCNTKLYEINPDHFYSNFVKGIEIGHNTNTQLDYLLNSEKYIISETPSNMIADLIYRISGNYAQQNDIENAIKYLNKLNDINDDSYKIRQNVLLGYLYSIKNDNDKSLEYYQNAINLDITDQLEVEAKKSALKTLFEYYSKKHMFNTAINYILILYNEYKEKDSKIYGEILESYKNYGSQIYHKNKYHEAIQIYKEMTGFIFSHSSDSADSASGDNTDNYKSLSDKYNLIGVKHIAECYRKLNLSGMADEWMFRGYKIDNDDYACNCFMGRYLMMKTKGEHYKSLRFFLHAEEKQKNMDDITNIDRSNTQYTMAIIYAKKNDYQKANICMEIAFNFSNDLPYLYSGQSLMKANQRDYDELYKNLKIVKDLKPWNQHTNMINLHLNGILDVISNFEFEFSATNIMALKCIIMSQYLKEDNQNCVDSIMQYRDIDTNDSDVNKLYDELQLVEISDKSD